MLCIEKPNLTFLFLKSSTKYGQLNANKFSSLIRVSMLRVKLRRTRPTRQATSGTASFSSVKLKTPWIYAKKHISILYVLVFLTRFNVLNPDTLLT